MKNPAPDSVSPSVDKLRPLLRTIAKALGVPFKAFTVRRESRMEQGRVCIVEYEAPTESDRSPHFFSASGEGATADEAEAACIVEVRAKLKRAAERARSQAQLAVQSAARWEQAAKS